MSSHELQAVELIPRWIFEQDYLVFLSFFGWLLTGLLAWTKPLSDNESRDLPWLWFGFYAFSQATSDFLRTLSFSDSFFREFGLEVGFEMLGYGLLVELAVRATPRFRNRSFFPYAGLGGLFLGLSIEIGDLLYTLVVSFLVSVAAVALAGRVFAQVARQERRPELYLLVAGLVVTLPAWLLAPERLNLDISAQSLGYSDFPQYGFGLLLLRVLAAWSVLSGFWFYRLQRRVEDVAPQIKEQLRFWGRKVLPIALAIIVLASYFITSWNGQRTRERMERDTISRAQTAALAMDARGIGNMSAQEIERQVAGGALATQLLAIQRVGSDVRSVYLWAGDATSVRTLTFGREGYDRPLIEAAHRRLTGVKAVTRGEPFLLGPLAANGKAWLSIHSPIVSPASGAPEYWLGIDMAGAGWFDSISLSRLQSIIIAGLVMALVTFFLYYQIDHESEADLVLAKERAEAADRAKSEFLAVISHEIRTPLQSVLGYSDLLRGTPLNEKQRACLDTIQAEGKILLRIVQDILDFSNLRKANFELKEGPVRLRRLIEETFRTIKPMADRKGLTATLEVADEVPDAIWADGVRLRQVLLNLFGNSVKYTEAGSVRLAAFATTWSDAGTDDRVAVTFEIADTGVGIRREDLGRLFEPFIQLEHSGKSPREGAGLGLAIVNRIAQLMGGRIDVRSEYGVGSTFAASFRFVALDPEEDRSQAALASEEPEMAEASLGLQYPLRLAVVDDNPMVRRLVAQYLEALGYEADQLDGGRPAVQKGLDYDVLLMDLRMPEIDGPAAAQAIRSKGRDPARPWIIAVSASLQEEEVKRAMEAGVNDFLGKPFFAPQLAEKLKAIPHFETFRVDPPLPSPVEAQPQEEPAQRLPLFIGPAIEEEGEAFPESTESKSSQPREPDGQKPASTSIFAGIGAYPAEAVRTAVEEVYTLHDRMMEARLIEDWTSIKETAHYLSNTAMALGIDQLYLDSKALQSAAEKADATAVDRYLPELRLNFQYWERSEESGDES